MTKSLLLCCVAVLASTNASAQTGPLLLAFPRSAGATIGVTGFGNRSSSTGGATFSYKGSLIVGGRYDHPLSRRTGLLLGLSVAPLSQQRGQGGESVVLTEKLMIGIVDAAVGFRLKPVAPVFVAAGGGITYATKPPANTASGAVSEPHALFAIGYDAPTSTRWNVRTVLTTRFVVVADDSDLNTTSESSALDWSFEVGARYRFGR